MKRHKPTIQRTKKEECVVQWDDKTENIVYTKEIENINTKKPISLGSKVKMLYKKKWYFGKVIEMITDLEQTTEEGNKQTEEDNQQTGEEQTVQETVRKTDQKTEEEASHTNTGDSSSPDPSSKEMSSIEDWSPADDTDDDPDYEQCCEAVGCREEVWAACHECMALMCYEHFLICEDLDCHRGHAPKKCKLIHSKQGQRDKNLSIINYANDSRKEQKQLQTYDSNLPYTKDVTDQFDQLAVIEEINEFTRTVGTQTKPNLTSHKSTQTYDEKRMQPSEEQFNLISPTEHTVMTRENSQLSSESQEKKSKGKQYFCIYCKRLVLNFARHLQTSHRNENDVEQLFALSKGSSDRRKRLDEIRGRGALYFNTSPELNKGDLIVRRRKAAGRIGYTPCPKCKNFYKKPSLHKHFKACTGQLKVPKSLQTTSLSLSMPVKGGFTDPWLKNEVLPGLSNKDDIRSTILEDSLLIEYGNYLCIRHRTNRHLTNMVRGKLRQMAKILKSMRKIDSEITTLESAIKPGKYDIFMKAVDQVAGYNPSNSSYRAPSLVTHIGSSAQECANILQTRAIKNEDDELQNRVINWLKLYKHKFYYGVGKSALNKVAENKWKKPRLVPVATDIMKLNLLIRSTIDKAKQTLKETFDHRAFNNLNRSVMLQIIIFNRKRIGEVEKLLVSDFQQRHNIQKDSEIYRTLSDNEKIVASRYMRMEVRGKLGRPVSLLISKGQVEMINMILKLREPANVSPNNPYVFGRSVDLKQKFFSAPSALRWFANNCGASRPDLLTGTKLRKHMATISQAMDLTENDLSILADFMGHNITTHRNFYRMPSEVTHLARISQVLMSLEEGDVSKYAGKRLDEINVDVVVDEADDELDEEQECEDLDSPPPVTTDQQEKRKSQPQTAVQTNTVTTDVISTENVTPTKRIHVSMNTPDQHFASTDVPQPTTKQKKRKRSPAMSSTQYVTPTKKIKTQKKTWKTPERHVARRVFLENIRTGRLPSQSDCLFALSEYKQLEGRTVDQLKAWVYNEINRNRRK